MEKRYIDIEILNVERHGYLKQTLGFPEYYGENFDALYDCLSEMEDTEIVFLHVSEANEFSIRTILVFDDVSDEYDNLTLTFIDEDEE